MRATALLLALAVSGCSAFTVAPAAAPARSSRTSSPAMLWRGAKGVPKGKVPEKTKGDDKSWGARRAS